MDLSRQEEEILKEFRLRVEHLVPESLKPDYELVKWLIAKGFNIEKAEEMLLKSLEWRKTWDVDNIFNWKVPEVLEKYVPRGNIGYDRNGCPLWIFPPSACQFKKNILKCASYRDYIRMAIFYIEKSRYDMRKQSEKLGRVICKHSAIFDIGGLALMNFTTLPAKYIHADLLQMYEANYPGHLQAAYVINAPKIFSLIFAIVKNYMTEGTLRRVHVYSSDYHDRLFQHISPDQIPKYYGGTMVDSLGDPKCSSMIVYMKEVPYNYYKTEDLKSNRNKYKNITLSRGEKHAVKVNIETPGSEIRWKFSCYEYDVGFGIYFVADGSGNEQIIIPIHKVLADLAPDDGSLHCSQTGIYNVIFDNEHSYWNSKTIIYSIEVIKPDQKTQLATVKW